MKYFIANSKFYSKSNKYVHQQHNCYTFHEEIRNK